MQKKNELIFELSETEIEARLKKVLKPILDQNAALQQPVVYRNSLCIKPNFFIHKFPNGNRLLIERNLDDSSAKTVKVLR